MIDLLAPTPVRAIGPDELAGPTPIYAVWELTMKCDQPCQHCGSRAGQAREDELGTEEILEVARGLVRLGTREVTVIGGEAYLRPDLLQIVRALAEGGIRVTMQTGGRAFSLDRARGLRDAGLDGLGVSVDGRPASTTGCAATWAATTPPCRRSRTGARSAWPSRSTPR